VNNDGLHGMRTRKGNKFLTNGPHSVELLFFERGGGAGMIFRYAGGDTADRMRVVPERVLLPSKHKAKATAAVKLTSKGLKEEVFYFRQGGRLPNLKGRKPSMTRTSSVVNYKNTGQKWPGFKNRDQFAVRWSGYLAIQTTGVYQFTLQSDDGSRLYLDNSRSATVNNDGLHGWRTRRGQKALRNHLHKIVVEFFEKGGHAGIRLSYKGPDTQNRVKVVPKEVFWKKANLAAQLSCRRYGLKEDFFFFRQGRRLPNLKGRRPAKTRIALQVNYASTGRGWPGVARARDNFAVRWTGLLMTSTPGLYQFYLKSDDGSKLYIDKKVVVNNDGLHGMRTRSGTKKMSSGPHKINLQFFEKGGGAGMRFMFKGPDVGNFPVVISRQFLRAPAKPRRRRKEQHRRRRR